MKNLAKAVLAVMSKAKYLNKDMTISAGTHSYKGLSDEKLREMLRVIMMEEGLIVMPIGIDQKTTSDRWEEIYKDTISVKHRVTSEVTATYLLVHAESGESQVLQGYGVGIDSQDKSAGKSTTFALKNCLLNLFLIPTGQSPDDMDISDEPEAIESKKADPKATEPVAKKKVDTPEKFEAVKSFVKEDPKTNLARAKQYYELTLEQIKIIESIKPVKK